MIALLCFFLTLFASPFKSKSRLEAENAALRHQLIVLQRRVSGRVQLTNGDRLLLVQLYRWFPSILKAIHDHPAGDPCALAPGRLPAILAVEIALPWRPTASRRGKARLSADCGDPKPNGRVACDGNHRYSWTNNKRSPFVRRMRPHAFRLSLPQTQNR
jgi:hypothetical protein